MTDREAMARALHLAWRGWARVGANPLVGAVVVRDGRIVGEGWHAEFGGPHAEIRALEAAGAAGARGADLVVTLEPCAHYGKTPPCAPAIARAGIVRVVYGAADPDPQARGGAALLRRCGVQVEGGLLEADVVAQNAVFFHRHRHPGAARPFVALKLAVSLDGRIADASRRSRWISGAEARAWVHWLRAGFEALGVGAGTVLADDPRLTVRGALQPPRAPLRVVFDARAETPAGSALARTARDIPVLVIAGPAADAGRLAELRRLGVEVAVAEDLPGALKHVADRGVASLLVEGGARLAGRLLAGGLVDRLFVVAAPVLLGASGLAAFEGLAGTPLERAPRWRTVGRRALGDDTLLVLDR